MLVLDMYLSLAVKLELENENIAFIETIFVLRKIPAEEGGGCHGWPNKSS